jgi:hypothetical protein
MDEMMHKKEVNGKCVKATDLNTKMKKFLTRFGEVYGRS